MQKPAKPQQFTKPPKPATLSKPPRPSAQVAPTAKAPTADFIAWRKAKRAFYETKFREYELRCKVIRHYFPGILAEGSHKVQIEGEPEPLVAEQNYKRKLDPEKLERVLAQMPGVWRAEGILWENKPTLKLKGYRHLTDAERRIFERCMLTSVSATKLSMGGDKVSDDE